MGRANNTYKCRMCEGVFEYDPDWSEEDARGECVDNFGEVPEDAAIICDDCYNKHIEAIKEFVKTKP